MKMLGNPKGVAALILGSAGKPKDQRDPFESMEAKNSCMEKFLIAMERKEPRAMARALSDFLDIYEASEDESED